ncbi:hypothetical protein Tco_0695647 [Tanacetum coccineum]
MISRLTLEYLELAVLCPMHGPNSETYGTFIGGLPQSIEGNVTASKPQTLEEATNIAHRLMDQIIKHDSVQETNNHKRKFEDKRNTIENNNYPKYRNNNNHSNNRTTTTIITITTVTMITTTSRIEDKKLLGLILPKDTMETFLCVQDAIYILSKERFATSDHLKPTS